MKNKKKRVLKCYGLSLRYLANAATKSSVFVLAALNNFCKGSSADAQTSRARLTHCCG